VVAGRYRVEGMIGEGGFGAVFRATQLNLGRTVALKVLQPDLVAHEESLSRFRREAQLAQRLEHPNTVRLFDFGRDEAGLPFIAWEMLKGQPLDALIKEKGGIPAQRVARIASQVLKSLMEAHSLGVVHRDIKPANIFICDFPGEPDFVKVLDFGIAKALHPEAGGTMAGLTQIGHAVGTPNYMAPEQVSGGAVGPASDLYALGLVMAEALTGNVVFTGETAIEVCMAQLSPNPVPHAAQVLQSPLGSVIHRATQKAPERRFASAAEMLRELESTMGGNVAAGASAPGRASFAGSSPGQAAPHTPGNHPMAFAQTNLFGAGASYPGGGSTPHAAGASYPGAGGGGSYPGAGGGGSYPGGGHGSFPGAPPGGSYPGGHAASYPGAPQYGGYMAPVGSAPMPYGPAPRAKGGSGCSVVLVLLLIGGALVAVAGIVLVVVLSASSVSTPTGGSGRPSGGSLQGRRFRDLSADDLGARIDSAGYSTTSKTSTESQGITITSFTVQKSNTTGSVLLYKYADARTAGFAEDALKQNNAGAVLRDENALLIVMIFPQDSATSQQLLDAITR